MITQHKRLTALLFTVCLLLVIPFIAMQFTNKVKWTLFDFAAAAVLLFGTRLLCELVIRKIKNNRYRIAICAALLTALLLIWLELAVGIFGTTFSGN